MVTARDLPAGYKQTDAGIIPDSWITSKFTDCAELKHGFQFREEHFAKDGICVTKIGNLIDGGGLDLRNATFVPFYNLEKFKNFRLNYGDVLMALTGATLGKVSVVDTNEITLQNYRVGNFFNKENSTKQYVYYILQSFFIQNTIKKLINEGAQPNLGKGDFDKFIIPLPPTKAEQTAIATALNDADNLITELEKLIAKKKMINQGAMQELLTGNKRLKGFDSETRKQETEIGIIPTDWDIKTIGEVCQIFGRIGFRGYTIKDIVDKGQGAISLSPSNIIDNELDLGKCTYVSWKKYEESPEIKINVGDIILVKTASIGKTAIIKSLPERATLNPQLVVFKKIKIDNSFLGYMTGFKIIQNQLITYLAGGVVPTLTQKQIAGIKFPVPKTKEEQKAIALFLSDMDSEIESLEKKLDKYKMIKQGMMQNLLTGKIRLV